MRKLFQIHSGKGDNVVNIDGREFSGCDIRIEADGKVVVDGVEQAGSLVGPVNVVIQGNVRSVETGSGNVQVQGEASSVKTGSGDVEIGSRVYGNVSTGSGDVTVRGDIDGNVTTGSGDILRR